MEHIGERLIWHYLPGTDIPIPMGGVNVLTVLNTIIVMVFLWAVLWLAVRKQAKIPGGGQILVEKFIVGFDNLVASSLELPTPQANRKFLPLIASLFLFLIIANFMGFPPSRLCDQPTADISCTLALGRRAMGIATYCGIKAIGARGYFEEMLGPMWSQEDAKGLANVAGKLSALFFFPLNVIGEMAKVVSISFRLFGNIIGGAIIIIVVSTLTFQFLFPIPLQLFFIFFVGAVQAFVFTMLTLTYIAVAIK